MDYPYGPKPKKTHPLVKTLEIASEIVSPTDGGDPEPMPVSPREVALTRSGEWGEFARGRGLPYRDELPVAEFVGDPRLKSFFDEIRELRFPLNSVGGFCEGTWAGVPFTSFYSYNFEAGGSLWPYRFACTPLPNPGPDLVYDRALQRKRPYHLHWYPQFAEYELVLGPGKGLDESKKVPGLLNRTALGRGIAKTVVDAVDNVLLSKIHTTSPERAAVVASRPHESEAFRHDWAVRGRWLVVFTAESQYKDHDIAAVKTAFLDSLVAVKRLVE